MTYHLSNPFDPQPASALDAAIASGRARMAELASGFEITAAYSLDFLKVPATASQ